MKKTNKCKSNSAGCCPICDSSELKYGNHFFNGDCLYFSWECNDCGAIGSEEYNIEFTQHINIYKKNGTYIEDSCLDDELYNF